MPTVDVDYNSFRRDLVDSQISEVQLEHLIKEFQPEINSKRRLCYINSLEDLIRLLEKRGVIGNGKIESFAKRFQTRIPSINLKEMMIRYQSAHRAHTRNAPHPAHMNLHSTAHQYSNALPPYSRQYSGISLRSGTGSSETGTLNNDEYGVLPKPAMDRIVRDIGTNWKDLARELGVREGEIDDIECKYPRSYKDRARESLKSFIDEVDPYKVQPKLLTALERCGRKDLKEAVDEILSRRPY